MKKIIDIQEEVNTRLAKGERGIDAVRNTETALIKQFSAERKELLDGLSYHITKAGRNKDGVAAMRLFIAGKNALEANAEAVNGDLATVAAGISKGKFIWTSKVQQPLVTRVALGEGTKMSGEAGREYEFKGFEGEKIINFFKSQDKKYWAKRAGGLLLGKVMAEVDAKDYKEIWRKVGSIASGAALFKEYCYYEADALSGQPILTSDKLKKMEEKLYQQENAISYASSNHYVQEFQDQLEEYKERLGKWEQDADTWKGNVGKIVAEYNAIMEWADEEIRLPTGELKAMHEWQRQSTVEGMQCAAVETSEFRARLALAKDKANEAFAALLK